MAKSVRIVEVGLRDGLQNESTVLSAQQRMDLLSRLIQAGTKDFEIGAFVSPKWVPQMAVTSELIQLFQKKFKSKKLNSSVLVPNMQGLKLAMDAGISEIAIFASSTESFSQKNINCSIDESFERFKPIMVMAKKQKIKVRGYLSVCFGCPYEGKVSEAKVVALAKKMIQMGCYEVSIGDTIGVANVGQVESVFKKLKKVIPAKKLAGHFHDTRGQALANILQAYKLGITTFDSSIGGLGGCPYAKGATGNVATEDVVYMFDGLQVKTGLNLKKLIDTNRWLNPQMNHPLPSKVGKVGLLSLERT
jgi:hydroxymethylglutaryl-CoA lyase